MARTPSAGATGTTGQRAGAARRQATTGTRPRPLGAGGGTASGRRDPLDRPRSADGHGGRTRPLRTARGERSLGSGRPRRPVGSTPVVSPPSPIRRQTVVLALVLALLTVFAGRLVHVQAVQGPSLAAEARDKRMLTVPVPGDRGDIVDADGVVLATSVERYNIVANQRQFAEAPSSTVVGGAGARAQAAAGAAVAAKAAAEAKRLEPLLGVPAAELGVKLLGDRQFVYLAKRLPPQVYRQIMALGIPGISGERTTDRVYPEGTTAGNIVGFVGAEGSGQAGMEQVFEASLAGRPGSQTYEQGRRGQRIPTGVEAMVPPVDGQDVQLTISRDLQYMVQQALDSQVALTGAQWGVVEVIDVRTGEILALADSGTVDPNQPGAAAEDSRGSRASWAAYEPGSTAKVITMAAVLDHGLATPTSRYVVPYTYATPNGQVFKDSHEHPDLNLTLTGILSESSNTGTVMVGQHLPEQVRHDYLSKFGFGRPTGVGLPGEGSGILHAAQDWDGRSKYAVLFGQAVSTTVLQATQVFAILGNGGVRVQPHLVKGVVDEDGVLQPVDLPEPSRVVSQETARTVMTMLESAVADGTGGNAAVPGYRIAGKTGTSQAFEGGGVVNNVASFIGVAPADDPRLAVSVVLYDPKTSIYGGDVAAPVFSTVTGAALRHLGVPPSGTRSELFPTTYE